MKRYSQIQKIISIFMISILSIQLSGCYSYKIISRSDLPLVNSNKYTYIIHSQNSKFRLEHTIISDGVLSGKIDTTNNTRHPGGKIHVWLLSDSVMKINAENTLSTPLSNIAHVEKADVDVIGTISLTLGIVMVVAVWIFLSSWNPGW